MSEQLPTAARPLPRRVVGLAAGMALAGMAMLGVGAWEAFAAHRPATTDAGLDSSPLLGRPAPVPALPGLDGKPLDPSLWRGKPLLLNFWATWCVPCRQELPALQRFAGQRQGRWAVVGIDELEGAGDVRRFADSLGVAYPLVADQDGSVGRRFLVQGLPTTVVVDATGIVRRVHLGALTPELLASL